MASSLMGYRRILGLVAALLLIGAAIWYLEAHRERTRLAPSASSLSVALDTPERAAKAARYPVAQEISTPDGFVNTDPITIRGLIGEKVIVVDFWTYSCINCQRTTPYLNAWYEKYKDQGLEIIGVHTPEFAFERTYENVRNAVARLGIKFPVVLDNDYSTWNAYQNRYWPHKYLIDIDGFVVYDHAGEGAYEETEQKIQAALAERAERFKAPGAIARDTAHPQGVSDVDFSKVGSRETYFGALRNQTLGNGARNTRGEQTLVEPDIVESNVLYLAGTWQIGDEFAKNTTRGAKIIFNYRAKSVYLVASADPSVAIRVLRDGKPLGDAAGADVDAASGAIRIHEDRLYKIIEDKEYGTHTLELIIERPGARIFAFTFG